MTKSPHAISEQRIELAEEYSKYSGQFAEMITAQAIFFTEMRKDFKSDTACQRAFDITEKGIRMAIIKMKLKSLEKMMSALNTHLRLLENEAKSLY